MIKYIKIGQTEIEMSYELNEKYDIYEISSLKIDGDIPLDIIKETFLEFLEKRYLNE